METNPTPTALATAAGISLSYASEILASKRQPSRSLALKIFDRTGLKFPPIAHLSEVEIQTLAQIEAKAA